MNNQRKIISSYSKSLFQSISSLSKKKEDKISKSFSPSYVFDKNGLPKNSENFLTIEQELIILKSFLLSSSTIFQKIANPTINESQKEQLLLDVFPGLSSTLKSFLKILKERNHLYLLPEITSEYQELISRGKNFVSVKLLIASPLEHNLGRSLFTVLKKLTQSSDIFLTVLYDPKLLNGIILEYNSIAIDLSLRKEFGNILIEF